MAMMPCVLGFSGCGEDDSPVTKSGKTPQETNLLVGTKWKLMGYFDVEADTLKQDGYENYEQFFILIFDVDIAVSGFPGNHPIYGEYKINFLLSTLELTVKADLSDFINVLAESKLYVEEMNKVRFFSFTDTELKLFYNDKKNYLLFERRY
jgi:hypothetical protein